MSCDLTRKIFYKIWEIIIKNIYIYIVLYNYIKYFNNKISNNFFKKVTISKKSL